MPPSNCNYRGRQIAVSVRSYRKGWLAEYSIDGGPFQRCDGRPLRYESLAMAEGRREAEARVDSMLGANSPLSL